MTIHVATKRAASGCPKCPRTDASGETNKEVRREMVRRVGENCKVKALVGFDQLRSWETYLMRLDEPVRGERKGPRDGQHAESLAHRGESERRQECREECWGER